MKIALISTVGLTLAGQVAAQVNCAMPGPGDASVPAVAEQDAQRAQVPDSRAGDEFSARVLAIAARRAGVDASELQIVAAGRGSYPLLGRSTHEYKLVSSSGQVLGVALDENAQEIDADELRLREDLARTKRFGRIDENLFVELLSADETVPLPIGLWLVEPEFDSLERPPADATGPIVDDPAHVDAFDAELARQRSIHLQQVNAPVVALLSELGVTAVADEATPIVYASLTPAQIREVATWEAVDRVYSARPMEQLLDRARIETRVSSVQALGMTGSNVKISQVEVGGRVALTPLINAFTQDTTYVCATANDHATAVAGILKSALASARGTAYGSQLFATGSCTGDVLQVHDRTNAGLGFGARSFNLSFGQDTNRVPGLSDRFYDNLVISRWRTFVVSAGNAGLSDGDVGSPGLAYNVITVGNYDMGATTSWGDGWMASTSSYRNPVSDHGDREKPEIAAPGTRIKSALNNGGWGSNFSTFPYYQISGTSFAAPMVTGVTAMMIQRNTALVNWPEAIKSILMTTAVHNIEGNARLSDRDGAGAMSAIAADLVVRRTGGDWGGMAYNCSFPTAYDLRLVYLNAGQRLRASIVWDTPTTFAQYAVRPSADLDLLVLNNSGVNVSASNSWDGTAEVIDFVAPTSGTYKLRVQKYRCEASPKYLGWSYSIQ